MSVLVNGYGSPFVKVYYEHFNKNTQKVEYWGISDNYQVTNFSYKYAEEEDDVAQIEFQTSDRTIADRLYFQEGLPLKVVWGYLGGPVSPSRLVYIRDIKYEASEVIKLSLTCTDKAAILKDNYAQTIWKATSGLPEDEFTVMHVLVQMAIKYGLKFRVFGQNFDFSSLVSQAPGVNPKFQYSSGPNILHKANFLGEFKFPNMSQAEQEKFSVLLNGLIAYKLYPQANKSDWLFLVEMLKKQPGGPWTISGRDNTLNIGQRNLTKPSIRSYTFGENGGDLLSFELDAKGILTDSQTDYVGVSHFDPENKEYTFAGQRDENTQEDKTNGWLSNIFSKVGSTVNLENLKDAGYLNVSTQLAAWLFKVSLSKRLGFAFKGFSFLQSFLAVAGVKLLLAEVTEDTNLKVGDAVSNDGIEGFKETVIPPGSSRIYEKTITLASGATIIKVITVSRETPQQPFYITNITFKGDPISTQRNAELLAKLRNGKIDFSKLPSWERDVLAPLMIHSREDSALAAKAQAENLKKENDLEKIKVSIKLVGNPALTDTQILSIKGVSNKYSGNYYIKECTHTLDGSGYFTSAELNSNSQGKPDVVSGTSTDAAKLPGAINITIGPEENAPQTQKTAVTASDYDFPTPPWL